MEVLSIEQAQVVLFVPTAELNMGGRVSVMNLAQALAERYKFAKYPKTYEEWASANGAEFALGRFNDITISKLTLFVNGIVIDTTSSTDDAALVLDDMFAWASQFGVKRPRDNTPRWCASALVFVSDLSLEGLHPAVSMISREVSDALRKDPRKTSDYEAIAMWWNIDESNVKLAPGAFRLERRLGAPFSEKKWWSSAPLATKKHIELLAEFEKAVTRT